MSGTRDSKKWGKPASVRFLLFGVLLIVASLCYYFFAAEQKESDRSVRVGEYESQTLQPKPVTPDLPVVTAPIPTRDQPVAEPSLESVPALPKGKTIFAGTARLAIIIDDMGSSLVEAEKLAAIKVPLTFAIIPGLRSDREVAAFAASHNIETIIHLPMQSKGWPARRLEPNGLLVNMESEELEQRVSGFVQRLPGTLGANNHMGSEFTEQLEKMLAVMRVLKKHDLFFIDSITTPGSIGIKAAERMGVKQARRNVFLDNELARAYIAGQLDHAVRISKKHGSAIAIGHPHPETIAALSDLLPKVGAMGVKLVPVSALVK